MNHLFDCQEDLLPQQNEPLKSKYSHHNHQRTSIRHSDFNEHSNETNVQEEVRKIEKTLIECARREKMSQQIRSELVQKLKLRNRNLRNLPKRIKNSNNNSNNISTNTSQIANQIKLADKQNTSVVNSSPGYPSAMYIFNHAIDQQWRKQSAMVAGLDKIDNISNRKRVQRAILSKKYKQSYRNKRTTVQLSSNKSITSLNNLQASKEAELVLQHRQQQKQILKQIQPTPFEKYYLHYCSGSLQPSPIKNNNLQSKIHSVNVSPQKEGKMSKNELQMIQNAIDHRLARRFNQKNNNFIFRMNQICKEVKSKEGKLNGYFKKFGEKFVPRQRASAEESQIKKIITWDLKGYQPAKYSKTQRKSIEKVNKSQQQKTNEIPSTLLTQIQTFYSLAQSSQNKNSFKRSHLNRTKSQLNTFNKEKQRSDEQFSDRKISKQNCLITQNKSLKICEKIEQLKKQKNKRAVQNKIWHSTCKHWSEKASQSPNTRLGRIIKYF